MPVSRRKRRKLAKNRLEDTSSLVVYKASDQVCPRPTKTKKKFDVPKAPEGVTFFRSLSKRPLQLGEVISESEDDMSEQWLRPLKHAEIDKLNFSEASRRFLEIYDDFIHEENPQSDRHLSDCIIRLARERGLLLCQKHITNEFTTKLNELVEEHLIPEEIRRDALDIVETKKANTHKDNELSQRLKSVGVQNQDTLLAPTDCGTRKDPVPEEEWKISRQAIMPGTRYPNRDVDMSEAFPVASKKAPDTTPDEDKDSPWGLCYCGQDATATPDELDVIICSAVVLLPTAKA